MLQLGPTATFAAAQAPAPEHMLVKGATPGAVNDASIETGNANAPDAHSSELTANVIAVKKFLFILRPLKVNILPCA